MLTVRSLREQLAFLLELEEELRQGRLTRREEGQLALNYLIRVPRWEGEMKANKMEKTSYREERN